MGYSVSIPMTDCCPCLCGSSCSSYSPSSSSASSTGYPASSASGMAGSSLSWTCSPNCVITNCCQPGTPDVPTSLILVANFSGTCASESGVYTLTYQTSGLFANTWLGYTNAGHYLSFVPCGCVMGASPPKCNCHDGSYVGTPYQCSLLEIGIATCSIAFDIADYVIAEHNTVCSLGMGGNVIFSTVNFFGYLIA